MCDECHSYKCPATCPNADYKPIHICQCCGEEIYFNDEYYSYNNDVFCQKECALDWLISENIIIKKVCDES